MASPYLLAVNPELPDMERTRQVNDCLIRLEICRPQKEPGHVDRLAAGERLKTLQIGI